MVTIITLTITIGEYTYSLWFDVDTIKIELSLLKFDKPPIAKNHNPIGIIVTFMDKNKKSPYIHKSLGER